MNIIKQLSEIKLEDLKSLDAAQIKERILSRPDLLVTVVLIGLTIYAGIFIYSGKKLKYELLKNEEKKLQEKMQIVDGIKTAEAKFKNFTDNFSKAIPSDQLVDKLSEFAVNRNVQILSFSPAEEKQNDYAKLTSVRLNITSESYENVVLFIKDIESAPYALRVDKWSGSMTTNTDQKKKDDQVENIINANLEIGAIKLNDAK